MKLIYVRVTYAPLLHQAWSFFESSFRKSWSYYFGKDDTVALLLYIVPKCSKNHHAVLKSKRHLKPVSMNDFWMERSTLIIEKLCFYWIYIWELISSAIKFMRNNLLLEQSLYYIQWYDVCPNVSYDLINGLLQLLARGNINML